MVQRFADAIFSGIKQDSVAWCAAAIGAMLKRAGHKPSVSLAARSCEAWGVGLEAATVGAIATKKRGDSSCEGLSASSSEPTLVPLLGSHHGDAWLIAAVPRKAFTAFRWPADVPLPSPHKLPTTIARMLACRGSLKAASRSRGATPDRPAYRRPDKVSAAVTLSALPRFGAQGVSGCASNVRSRKRSAGDRGTEHGACRITRQHGGAAEANVILHKYAPQPVPYAPRIGKIMQGCDAREPTMTSRLPEGAKPGDIVTPDGQILCRDLELHEFGYFTVTYEQAQVARKHGWGCRAGVVLDGEHSDEWSWDYAEEERRTALENGDEPPRVRIYREPPASCPVETPLSCRLDSR